MLSRNIFIVSILSFLLKSIDCHGLLCTPRQRGAYVDESFCGSKLSVPSDPRIDYCPHCGNQGGLCGKSSVMIGAGLMPYSEIPIVAHYISGQEVDFQVKITAHHNGHILFHLCDLDSCGTKDIDGKCFQQGNCYELKRVLNSACESSDVDTNDTCGPIDESYPNRWYLPCHNRLTDDLYGGSDGSMRYKLPDGISCEHCVLQWQWWSANACHAPGVAEYYEKYKPFACNVHVPNLGSCDIPEEFAGCADVKISSNGNSGERMEPSGSNSKSVSSTGSNSRVEPPSSDSETVSPDGNGRMGIKTQGSNSDTTGQRSEMRLPRMSPSPIIEKSDNEGGKVLPSNDGTESALRRRALPTDTSKWSASDFLNWFLSTRGKQFVDSQN